ncbi:hypothetical protein ACIQBJ_21625 [Kitasatospora sp. NPDC088391]|uniref:DUF7927 domain-containing protein n=1 Tax=Kitasatospora sp. NPDC088391 TaxID=3364074 RepID=UPI0037F3F6AE
MLHRRPSLPRLLGALCAVLPVAGLLVPLAAAPAVPAVRGAGTQRPIGPAPAVNLLAHGNLTMASNSVLTCDSSDGSVCNDTEGTNNNRTKYVKTDPAAPGNNASSAQLEVPAGAQVLSARLYWQFNPTNTSTNGTPGDIAKGDRVSWKVPGAAGYQQLTADTYDWFDQQAGGTPPEPLLAGAGVKDVTAEVRAAGPGSYTVADLQACAGRSSAANWGGNNVGCWGGWSLVVAYEDPADPLRYLNVWDGFQLLRSPDNLATLTLGGIRTPATTAPRTTLGVTVGDGDVPISGDELSVGPDTGALTLLPMPGPAGVVTDNAFTSRIDRVAADGTGSNTTTRDPAPVNNYGYDARTVDVTGKLPAGSSQAVLRINGAGDALHPQAVWLAVDALEPDLRITKSNSPAGSTDDNPPGEVEPGGTVTYTFAVENKHADGSSTDLDTATGVTVTDELPAGASCEAGSNPDCAASGRTVTCRVADLAPGAATSVSFRATVDRDAAAGTRLDDTATLDFRGVQTQRAQTRTSNTVRNTVVDRPAYRIEKTATPATARTGDRIGYRITVTNTGRVAAPGVALDDDLTAVLAGAVYNGDAAADLGTATVTGSTLHWTGDLAVGATATVTYSVTARTAGTLRNTVGSTTYRNNCGEGSTDAACRAVVTVTAPDPTPEPSPDPTATDEPGPSPSASPTGSTAPQPAPSPTATDGGSELPSTGTAEALPLIGLAALGLLLTGLLVLATRARRRH